MGLDQHGGGTMDLSWIGGNALKNLTSPSYSIVSSKTNEVLMEFDAIDECSITGSATATKYPSELGVRVTDYKYSDADQVKMTGIISSGGVTGFASIYRRVGISGERTWDRVSAISRIREELAKLCKEMTLVDIQTRSGGLRRNLTLVGYVINETYDNYGSMEVEMTFQEVLPFDAKGNFVRVASDANTEDTGISFTQVVNVAVAGALVAGSVIGANRAAFA